MLRKAVLEEPPEPFLVLDHQQFHSRTPHGRVGHASRARIGMRRRVVNHLAFSEKPVRMALGCLQDARGKKRGKRPRPQPSGEQACA